MSIIDPLIKSLNMNKSHDIVEQVLDGSTPFPTAMRPLLFLDVDGVLNPWKASKPPKDWHDGWHKHKFTGGILQDGVRIWVNKGQAAEIINLSTKVEIVWATTWVNYPDMLDELAEYLGFSSDLSRIPETYSMSKFERVSIYAKENGFPERTIIWIDDDLTEIHIESLGMLHENSRYYVPDPMQGLTKATIDTIFEFLDFT